MRDPKKPVAIAVHIAHQAVGLRYATHEAAAALLQCDELQKESPSATTSNTKWYT